MVTIGDIIPAFELPNQDDELVNIEKFRGKTLVLFAFPMASTPQCTKQACIYRDIYSEFTDHNAVVLGISSSPAPALKKWRKHHNFPYEMLSDMTGEVLDQLGAWSQYEFQGMNDTFARRSYWIIDEYGVVQEAQIGVDAENSVHESLQFILQQAEAV